MSPNPPTVRQPFVRGVFATLVLLVCFAMVSTGLPTAQAAPQDPSTPAPAAPSPGPAATTPGTDPGRAASTPAFSPVQGRRNVATLVRRLSPSDGALVPGHRLRVRIRLARGAQLDTARLDGRPVTRYLKRSGRTWSGRVPAVAPGVVHLRVTARKGGKAGLRSTRFTVSGQRADLLSELPPTVGGLGAEQLPGVAAVALTAHPEATLVGSVNGRRVEPALLGQSDVGNARRFVVSRLDGLHRGRNVITTTAFLDDGRWERAQRVVTVPSDTPLAEAGRGGRFDQGEVVRLDGSRSQAASRRGRLGYRWRLVSAPAGAVAPGAATSRRATLRLSAPGHYVVALTVTETRGSTSRRSTDLVGLTSMAVRPAIGARIQTLTPNTANLPPARTGASTSGTGMAFDGRFRSFTSDFTANGVVAKAGLYRIDPQTLSVVAVPLPGSSLEADVAAALAQAVKGEILVLQVPEKRDDVGPHVIAGPYSHVVAYDGNGTTNFWDDGSTNDGLALQTTGTGPDPLGSLSGHLRMEVDSTKAATGYRFVRDSGHVGYSTNIARTATTAADSGAVYRLVSTTSGQAVTSQPGSPDAHLTAKGVDQAQQWQLLAAYAGFYTVTDQATGRCLTARGDDVVVDVCDPRGDAPDQLWFPRFDQSRAAYRLVAAVPPSGQTANAPDGTVSVTSGGSAGLRLAPSGGQDQLWTFDVPPGVYAIRVASPSNRYAGQVLADPDYGSTSESRLTVATDTGELTQRWRVVDQPPGAGGRQRFSLVNAASGQCADVFEASTDDATAVNRYPCKGADDTARNQQWEPVATPAGLELHVAPPVGSTADQAALAVGTDGDVVAQQIDSQAPVKQVWALERAVDPAPGDLAVMSVPDVAGRSLQRSGASGSSVLAATTAAPAAASTWKLGTTGSGQVQLQDPSGATCLGVSFFGASAMGSCTSPDAFTGARQPDGRWTFATRSGALAVGADGGLGLARPGAGTPFLALGQNGSMRVGGHQYRTTAAIGQSGFWVLAFDQTLSPLTGYPKTFVTNGLDADSGARLANALSDVAGHQHASVLVQSFGRPAPASDAWNAIPDSLAKFGVDGRRVLQLDHRSDFAAAGCVECEDAPQDDEPDRATTAAPGGARLEGELGWTATSTRAPLNGATLPVDQGLNVLAERERTGWPFDDLPDSPDHRAVMAIHTALGGWPDACHSDADALRNTYCGGDAADWAVRLGSLKQLTYATASRAGSGFDEGDFDLVKQTVLGEVTEVQQVHSLFEDLHSLLLDRFVSQTADFSPDGIAEHINDTIYAPKGPVPVTNNNPQNVGGWLDASGGALLVLKDVVEVGTLLATARDGARSASTSSPAGGVYDTLADGLLFAATVVELAGADDGSEDGSLDVEAPLHEYQDELTAKLADALDNLGVVRDIVLTDPVALQATATNRQYGSWQLTTAQKAVITTSFGTGITRDLWPRQLGAGFQLWRWPRLLEGYGVTDIIGEHHWIYTSQPTGASALPVVRVDGHGAARSRATYTLTRTIAKDDLLVNNNRVLPPSVARALYEDTDLVPADLPALAPLRRKPCDTAWPFTKVASDGQYSTGIAKRTGRFNRIDFADRPELKDWTDPECSGG